jgi:hypothetical protein
VPRTGPAGLPLVTALTGASLLLRC